MPHCQHKQTIIEPDGVFCKSCGDFITEEYLFDDFTNIKTSHYVRNTYVITICDQVTGNQYNPKMFDPSLLSKNPMSVLQHVVHLLPDNYDWKDVHKSCRDNYCVDDFHSMPYFFGQRVQIPQLFFNKYSLVEIYNPAKKGMNTLYLIFKFAELVGLETKYIPLHLAQVTLSKYDKIWSDFCDRWGYRFVKTKQVLLPKSELLEMFERQKNFHKRFEIEPPTLPVFSDDEWEW